MQSNYKSLKNAIIAILTLSIAGVVLSYYYYFKEMSISTDTTDWGNFGDYINGMITPIIGMINIVILYYISMVASKMQEQSDKIQKVIARNQLINEIIKEATTNYNVIIKAIGNNDKEIFAISWYKIVGQLEILEEVLKTKELTQLILKINEIGNKMEKNYEEANNLINGDERIVRDIIESRTNVIYYLYKIILQ